MKDIWIQYHEPRVSNTADILEKDKYLHIVNKYGYYYEELTDHQCSYYQFIVEMGTLN